VVQIAKVRLFRVNGTNQCQNPTTKKLPRRYMYMYCIYVCVYIHIYRYTHTHTNALAHKHTRMRMCVRKLKPRVGSGVLGVRRLCSAFMAVPLQCLYGSACMSSAFTSRLQRLCESLCVALSLSCVLFLLLRSVERFTWRCLQMRVCAHGCMLMHMDAC